VGLFGLLQPAGTAQAATGINQEINYEGRLLNSTGGLEPDGTYSVQFKIYQDGTGCVSSGSSPCGGTLLWTENDSVTTINGYFSVPLGAVTSLSSVNFNSDTLWLSINVNSNGEMLPFLRFAASPYALNSLQLNGLTSTQYGQLAASNTFTGSNVFQTTSTTAFQIQQASGPVVFNANTSSGQITIYGGLYSAATQSLGLDTTGSNAISIGTTNAAVVSIGSTSNGIGIYGTTSLAGGFYGTQVSSYINQWTLTAITDINCGSGFANGAFYYNANAMSTSLRECENNTWTDVTTLQDLGILSFGIVPDSGDDSSLMNNIGNLNDVTSVGYGPCKVSWKTSTTIAWQACEVYSGGRAFAVTAGTSSAITKPTSGFYWYHVYVNASGAVTVSASGNTSETGNLSTTSLPSLTSPLVNLADVELNSSGITAIYDTRVYTTDTKTFGYTTSAVGLGWSIKQTTTNGVQAATTGASAPESGIQGVVVASTGASGSGGTPNIIYVTAGPTYIKTNGYSYNGSTWSWGAAGTGAVSNQDIVPLVVTSGTIYTGWVYTPSNATWTSTYAPTAYSTLGIANKSTSSNTAICAAVADCQYSVSTDLDVR
jgi:hypothetical protein